MTPEEMALRTVLANRSPRTAAGRALLRRMNVNGAGEWSVPMILAIEDEDAPDALREADIDALFADATVYLDCRRCDASGSTAEGDQCPRCTGFGLVPSEARQRAIRAALAAPAVPAAIDAGTAWLLLEEATDALSFAHGALAGSRAMLEVAAVEGKMREAIIAHDQERLAAQAAEPDALTGWERERADFQARLAAAPDALRDALERIVALDYRGNEPEWWTIARAAIAAAYEAGQEERGAGFYDDPELKGNDR